MNVEKVELAEIQDLRAKPYVSPPCRARSIVVDTLAPTPVAQAVAAAFGKRVRALERRSILKRGKRVVSAYVKR